MDLPLAVEALWENDVVSGAEIDRLERGALVGYRDRAFKDQAGLGPIILPIETARGTGSYRPLPRGLLFLGRGVSNDDVLNSRHRCPLGALPGTRPGQDSCEKSMSK